MATTIGIVYATGSKMIRRVVVPDNDAQLQLPGWVGPGESLMIAPQFAKGNPAPAAHVIDQVTKATGVTPPDPACALVADGVVEKIIAADPEIDTVEGKTLVAAYSKDIAPGCTYDEQAKLFTKPAMRIPAGVDKVTGQPTLQRDIPATVIEKNVIAADIGDVQL